MAEAANGLATIDGYQTRFERMKVAYREYMAEHDAQVIDPPTSRRPWLEYHGHPDAPKRIPASQLKDARNRLTDSAYRFVRRLYHERFCSLDRFRAICDQIQTSIDPADVLPEDR